LEMLALTLHDALPISQTSHKTAASTVRLFNPGSDGDNPQDAKLAVDGDPDTSWQTDLYKQQLPALKPGVGLLASFDDTVNLSKRSEEHTSELQSRFDL